MIEKMNYVNIMGHVSDFDRVVEHYIARYGIHLEYAAKELSDTAVQPFRTANPYGAVYREAEKLRDILGVGEEIYYKLEKEPALELLKTVGEFFQNKTLTLQALETRQAALKEFAAKVEPFTGLEFNVESLENFEFIKLRFGRMPYGSYKQFETFLYANQNILFVEAKKTDQYMYGLYFVPAESSDRADSLLSSFHFERIWMSFELDGEKQQGSLKKVYTETLEKIRALDGEIRGLHQQELGGLGIQHHEFASACHTVRELHACFEARKYAAKTKHDFYIFVGWMTEAESQRFRREAEADPMVVVTVEEETQTARAPTLLSNPFFARPFEFFVKLYGLPSYNEIDPTSFVALTYTLLFGIMFGDVGQGAALALAGLYMHKARKMPLGAILVILGGSSMVFGALYGSVFGFEDILPAFWLKPTENINSILFVAVGIGVVFILLVMIFNMVNAASQRKWGKLLCSPQGVAGACFYGALIYWILMMVLNVSSALGAVLRPVLIGVMAVALLCVAFHEPAAALLAGRRLPRKPGPAMFLLETFIELFEVLLGYFSNTLSFVRVGAFALSHAGMMHVVMMLSETGGHRNWLVVVLGNLLVIALEGLVVAIQVLRLEFYELFSRFFEGGGRPFVPFNR